MHLNKQAPNTTRNASVKSKKFNISSAILNTNNDAEGNLPVEAETKSPETRLSDPINLNNLPDGKEASLWENANLILSENTKSLEILEHKNHLEILEEKEKPNNEENPETPVNSNKGALNGDNQNSNNINNELLITQTNENIEMDSNEKILINNVIENINKFMDSNSSSTKNKEKKKHSYKDVKTSKAKDKKSAKKVESKRLKDLINEGESGRADGLYTEGNAADIHDLKNKILKNNDFQSKKFKERKFNEYLFFKFLFFQEFILPKALYKLK